MLADGNGRAAVLLSKAYYPQIHLPYLVEIHQLSRGVVFPLALINGQNSKKRVLKHFKFVYHVKLNPHIKNDGVY